MYDKILVTLDCTPTDRAIIEHVKLLAKLTHSHLVARRSRLDGPPERMAPMP